MQNSYGVSDVIDSWGEKESLEVHDNLNDFFRTQHTVHILDLFARSLVAPDNRRTDHLSGLI